MANLLLVCTEPALCEGDAARSLPPAAAKLAWPAAPGAAALRAKYAVLAAVLATGVGVLSTHVATVLLQDPFANPNPNPDPNPNPNPNLNPNPNPNPNPNLLQDPFASLYRDADIEAMSSGWDDGSAYGYNHVIDDPTLTLTLTPTLTRYNHVIDDPAMGFTRFCHGSLTLP